MNDQDQDDLHTFRLQDIFDKRYASKSEVRFIRAIVFGGVTLLLTSAFITALTTLHLHI